MPYEYMPPHGGRRLPNKTAPEGELKKWEVVIPWGSETITRTVDAVSVTKALNKVAMQISRSTNTSPQIVFKRIHHEKRFSVKPVTSGFLARADSIESLDKERIERLPKVVVVFENIASEGQKSLTALMSEGCSPVDLRLLTSDLQNMFGARLRSSGQTEVTHNGVVHQAVTIRLSTS